jgi:hypothetical protein
MVMRVAAATKPRSPPSRARITSPPGLGCLHFNLVETRVSTTLHANVGRRTSGGGVDGIRHRR